MGDLKRNILAIDPGNMESAYVVWNPNTNRMVDKDWVGNKDLKNSLFVNQVRNNELNIGPVLIETVSSYGMAVGQETFDTAIWTGIFKEFFENLGHPVHLIFRMTVKMHHCHSLRKVNDAAVNKVLVDKYGQPQSKKREGLVYWNDDVENNGGRWDMKGDIWAAMALATYWVEPHDHPIENEFEWEQNKLARSLWDN